MSSFDIEIASYKVRLPFNVYMKSSGFEYKAEKP
jgi:hypothetical protein